MRLGSASALRASALDDARVMRRRARTHLALGVVFSALLVCPPCVIAVVRSMRYGEGPFGTLFSRRAPRRAFAAEPPGGASVVHAPSEAPAPAVTAMGTPQHGGTDQSVESDLPAARS